MEQSQPVQPSQHRLPHHALLSFVTNNVVEVRTRLNGGYAPESESRLLAFSERQCSVCVSSHYLATL